MPRNRRPIFTASRLTQNNTHSRPAAPLFPAKGFFLGESYEGTAFGGFESNRRGFG